MKIHAKIGRIIIVLLFYGSTNAAIAQKSARSNSRIVSYEYQMDNCDEGIEKANSDLKKGKMAICTGGLREGNQRVPFLDILRDSFGFEIVNYGCVVFEGYECYNNTILEGFKNKIGLQAYGRFLALTDSMEKADSIEELKIRSNPSFPGGSDSLTKYLQTAFGKDFTPDSSGVVLISFEVNRLGKLEHIIIEKGLSELVNRKCISVFENASDFIPATKYGKPVSSSCQIPITIEIE